MADGTRDWGNGLHQMSLLARGEKERGGKGKRETQERVFEETPRERRRHVEVVSFSPSPILCARSFPHRPRDAMASSQRFFGIL